MAIPEGMGQQARGNGLRGVASDLVFDAAALLPRVTPAGLRAAARNLWIVLLGPLVCTGAALGVLLACDLYLFRDALLNGLVYYRADTITYYFPIADRLADVLREGRLLLWTRHIFGGFPLFADGEAGMLYPPNLVGYQLLSEQEAFIWLRVVRYFMAGTFTYAYLRALRLNGFAATLGSVSFTFGSFMIMQMHHTNVVNTALWLPLTLYMIEMALQKVRRWRWLYASGAGVAVGIQALGLHVQPLLMSGIVLAAYIPFRVMLCPIAWPRPRRKAPRSGLDPEQLAAVSPLLALAQGRLSPAPGPRGAPPPPGGAATGRVGAWTGVASRLPRLQAWLTRFLDALRLGLVGRRLAPVLATFKGFVGFVVQVVAALFHRSVLMGLLLGMVPAIAFGIAAVQLLPLTELGLFSFRGGGVNYQFATSYSLPVQNLVDLVFPYFFRYTNRSYWSLWSEWETTLYAGIAPLVLASIAVLFVRNRMVLLFAGLATAGTFIALGGYSPWPLYDKLYQLPGFSALRVPARWTMVVTFAIAVLAAYGTDWLCRTLRPFPPPRREERKEGPLGTPQTPPGLAGSAGVPPASLAGKMPALPALWQRLSRIVGINGFALYLLGLLTAMAGTAWWLVSFRLWIEKEPWAVKRFVEESYLSLRTSRPWLTSDMVLTFLNYSLDPTNEKTAISLALMLATFLLLFSWFAFRRLWRAWAGLLVLLVAADMTLFATDFHPTVHINQLSLPDSAARWLMAQNSDGMDRVYTAREVRKTEANKLLPFQVADITGYSSLETTRHQEMMGAVNDNEKALLDLFNVRFVILPKRATALPSFENTAYHPTRPLADGPRDNRGANVTFYMNPTVKTDEVCFISGLRGAAEIPQDADVAEIVVVDTQGERETLEVKAGRDTAEWAYDRPDVTPFLAHKKPRVADKSWVTDLDGRRYEANLYYADLKLSKTRTVAKVEFHYIYPTGKVRLFGMMLWENPRTAHQLLARDKFIPRYEDDEVLIAENPSRLPRAFLTTAARVVKPADMVDTMVRGDFDPEKVVLLESPGKPGPLPLPDPGIADEKAVESWLRGSSGSRPGSAQIVDYQSTELQVRTSSDRNEVLVLSDSYYPGWKALIDGREEPIYRADYLFRAVLVPAGRHEVRFVFEPESVALGTDISVFAASSLLAFWALMLLGVPLFQGVRWAARRPARWRAR